MEGGASCVLSATGLREDREEISTGSGANRRGLLAGTTVEVEEVEEDELLVVSTSWGTKRLAGFGISAMLTVLSGRRSCDRYLK